jgi:transcriptional/translational regulatory protein YebC/TACO1
MTLHGLLLPWWCAGDVKSAITKGGGKAADSGSVMFNFMRQVCVQDITHHLSLSMTLV